MSCVYKTLIPIVAVVEPYDVITICEEGGAMFSCVLNTANTNISSDDVHWYRFLRSTGTTEMIGPNETDIAFTTNHSRNALTTTLTITNVVRSHTGYYWVGLLCNENVCNVFATVETSM